MRSASFLLSSAFFAALTTAPIVVRPPWSGDRIVLMRTRAQWPLVIACILAAASRCAAEYSLSLKSSAAAPAAGGATAAAALEDSPA